MNYNVPYQFVLKELYPLRPQIKKMLGCYGLSLNKKLVILLRDRDVNPEYNGVFIATQPNYYEALQNEIHTSRMEFDLDGSKNSWIFISEDLEDFEAKVAKACTLLKNNDERIGK